MPQWVTRTRTCPAYGGYCAYAVSQGYTAGIDPEAWHIADGKLYLNYSQSVRKTWLKDVPGYVAQADKNWPKSTTRMSSSGLTLFPPGRSRPPGHGT